MQNLNFISKVEIEREISKKNLTNLLTDYNVADRLQKNSLPFYNHLNNYVFVVNNFHLTIY